MSTVGCAVVCVLAMQHGDRHIRTADWASLGAACGALLLWRSADDPLSAAWLLVAIDAFGFLPTVRKSFAHPNEETASLYVLNGLRYLCGIAALTSFVPEAWLYGAWVVASQWGFALFLYALRRRPAPAAA
jgi:hypothetical protein